MGEIRRKEPISKLSLSRYYEFGEMEKLMLTFKTYYRENVKINNNEIIRPTCGRNTFSKAQLAIRRKNTPTFVEEYWKETKACEMCENEGCGKLFKTYKM